VVVVMLAGLSNLILIIINLQLKQVAVVVKLREYLLHQLQPARLVLMKYLYHKCGK
jgi:hypothetical protein